MLLTLASSQNPLNAKEEITPLFTSLTYFHKKILLSNSKHMMQEKTARIAYHSSSCIHLLSQLMIMT